MIKAAILIEEFHRTNEADKLAVKYMNQKMQWSVTLILPLLFLDAIVTPVAEPKPACSCSVPSTIHDVQYKKKLQAARNERDHALLQARYYRDLAEATRAGKRALKHKNKEGSSFSTPKI